MFNSGNFSVLDAGMSVEGDIACDGHMVIKGTIKGTLQGNTIIIGQEGEVQADLKAGDVTIGGKFDGTLRALNDLIILPTGSCNGKVVCKNLVVEPGGILNAEVTRLTPSPEGGFESESPKDN